MADLGRMSSRELNDLPTMDPVKAAVTLRAALSRCNAICVSCGARSERMPRVGTTYAGSCGICGGTVEMLDRS